MMRAAQKAELEKTLWKTANELRGHVDGWDFKSYVLGMLFYRFISENLTHFINEGEREAGEVDFDYAQIDDEQAEQIREAIVEEKGFFMPPLTYSRTSGAAQPAGTLPWARRTRTPLYSASRS